MQLAAASASSPRAALGEVTNLVKPEHVASLGEKGLLGLARKSLQQLAKQMGLKANQKSSDLVAQILNMHAIRQSSEATPSGTPRKPIHATPQERQPRRPEPPRATPPSQSATQEPIPSSQPADT
eukprot:1153983-Prorocentrum_minimum.AAC.1